VVSVNILVNLFCHKIGSSESKYSNLWNKTS
jgi:hypothetical protein